MKTIALIFLTVSSTGYIRIQINSVYANGEYTDKIYEEQPPAPPAPTFDPKEYVRRDELDERVSAIVLAQMANMVQQPQSTPVTTPKKYNNNRGADE